MAIANNNFTMAKSKFGKWLEKTFNVGHAVRDNRGFGKFLNSTFGVVENLYDVITGAGMTGRDTELSDTSLRNQQILNEQEYDRKIDFYERYESPEAQVRQYKDAGLNPALMYGNGASISASGGIGSAGSAPAQESGNGVGALLSAILGFVTQKKRNDNEFSLGRDRNDIAHFEATTRRMQAENYGKYLEQLTLGKQYENSTFFELFDVRKANIEGDTQLKWMQQQYLNAVINSEGVRQRLMESGITVNNEQALTIGVQRAILSIQKKYSDQYFKATAELQEAAAKMSTIDATNYEKLQEQGKLLDAASAQLADLVIRAGMDAEIFTGAAFEKGVAGKMTSKERAQFLAGIFKTLATAGTAIGLGVAKFGAGALMPPAYPGTSPYFPQQTYTF